MLTLRMQVNKHKANAGWAGRSFTYTGAHTCGRACERPLVFVNVQQLINGVHCREGPRAGCLLSCMCFSDQFWTLDCTAADASNFLGYDYIYTDRIVQQLLAISAEDVRLAAGLRPIVDWTYVNGQYANKQGFSFLSVNNRAAKGDPCNRQNLLYCPRLGSCYLEIDTDRDVHCLLPVMKALLNAYQIVVAQQAA